MIYGNIISSCKSNLSELASMVGSVEKAVLNEEATSSLIQRNINIFTKSFLLTLCANLETCIKDVLYSIAMHYDAKLEETGIPLAVIDWRYNAKNKKNQNDDVLKKFKIGITKKDVDDMVSGNVYKTRDAFLIFGIDLACDCKRWETWKEIIQSIVTRRNNIVHHNDDASDLSFGDIKDYIKCVDEYLDFIEAACGRLSSNLSDS